jgi:hypothetical protein
MILATPALPAALAMTPEQMIGVLTNLEIARPILLSIPPTFSNNASSPSTNPLTANPATNLLIGLATNLSPTAQEPPPLIPRDLLQRQDRWSPLTNQDGLVILSKSRFLTKLRFEWRYLLDLTQMLNLCFFFGRPILHQAYHQANANSRLVGLGPLSPTCWKHMAKIHCLFPSDVGHMYIAKRANLPHYQEVFSNFLEALNSYHDWMPVYRGFTCT